MTIFDLPMPKNCAHCPACVYDEGNGYICNAIRMKKNITIQVNRNVGPAATRPSECPIAEVKNGYFIKDIEGTYYWHMDDDVPKFDPEAMAERLKKDATDGKIDSLYKLPDFSAIYDSPINSNNTNKIPQIIYTIWSGEYSDRCVEYFCYTEDEAKRICAYLNENKVPYYGDYYYEETELYDGKMVEKACHPRTIIFTGKEHGICNVRERDILESVKSTVEIEKEYVNKSFYCAYCGRNINYTYNETECPSCKRKLIIPAIIPDFYRVTVFTDRDEEATKKIAEDALAKYLAEEEGL